MSVNLYDAANNRIIPMAGSVGEMIEVDDELSGVSTNPVENQAITKALEDKADLVDGKIPSSQLPSYVDQINEGYLYNGEFYEDLEHTIQYAHETDKIYIDISTNKSYRWSGSAYAEISESLALGETSSTAYRGDRGKTAYDDSQTNKTAIGTLANLLTTAKSNLVAAINELFNNKQDTMSNGTGITITNGTVINATNVLPLNYKTTEQVIGTWIDGKPLYQKTVNFGVLPNNTTRKVQTTITNLKRVVFMEGYSYGAPTGTTRYFLPMPMVNNTNGSVPTNNVTLWVEDAGSSLINIVVTSTADRSGYTETYVTLRYTKTTD